MPLIVESIEDISKEEVYIADLENEIDSLKVQLKKLRKELKHKPPKQLDTNCCEAYKIVVSNFHKLLDEILPF